MEAGRELDALVAEKVMGLHGCPHWSSMGPRYGVMHDAGKCVTVKDGIPHTGQNCYPEGSPPPYSTHIAAAWEVVGKLCPSSFNVALRWFAAFGKDPEGCDCQLWRWDEVDSGHVATAPTAPHAICLAALKAVGVELGG